MWFTSSSGLIEIKMTRDQAMTCAHPGPCDGDVLALSRHLKIWRQLDKINPDVLRGELKGYGAWSDEALMDHSQNLQRILWVAAGNICDQLLKFN